jgi:hypothetical protein
VSVRPIAAALAAILFAGQAEADDIAIPQVIHDHLAHWIWRGNGTTEKRLVIDLAKAQVDVLPSPGGNIEIDATAPDLEGDGSPVELRIQSDGHQLIVVDRYPAASGFMRECPPPDPVRGDFVRYGEELHVVIRVPRALSVSGRVMAGSIVFAPGVAH